jgi:hypothetical protein
MTLWRSFCFKHSYLLWPLSAVHWTAASSTLKISRSLKIDQNSLTGLYYGRLSPIFRYNIRASSSSTAENMPLVFAYQAIYDRNLGYEKIQYGWVLALTCYGEVGLVLTSGSWVCTKKYSSFGSRRSSRCSALSEAAADASCVPHDCRQVYQLI